MIAAGAVLMTIPLTGGFSAAATVTGVAVGAIAVGLGIAGTGSDGRGTLPISAQAAYDRGLSLGLLLVALLFGFAGDGLAMAIFGAAGLAALAVTLTTRYSATPY